jgi:hypothetical protein
MEKGCGKYYPSIYLKAGLRKTTKNSNQDSQSPRQNLNSGPSTYIARCRTVTAMFDCCEIITLRDFKSNDICKCTECFSADITAFLLGRFGTHHHLCRKSSRKAIYFNTGTKLF